MNFQKLEENITYTKKKKKKSVSASSVRSILATDSDWPFPDTYYKSIGSTMSGFWFFYPNLSTTLKNLIQPTLILSFLQSCISFHLWLVCLSHIWHASKQMPPWFRLCSINSELFFKKLIGLIFKKDAIDNARSIASMLNDKWLQVSKNQLEPSLVYTGAGTKAVLASAQVAAEKMRLFRYECIQIIIKILKSWRKDAHFSSAL